MPQKSVTVLCISRASSRLRIGELWSPQKSHVATFVVSSAGSLKRSNDDPASDNHGVLYDIGPLFNNRVSRAQRKQRRRSFRITLSFATRREWVLHSLRIYPCVTTEITLLDPENVSTSSRCRQKYTAIRIETTVSAAPNSVATYQVLVLNTVSGSKNLWMNVL